MPRWKERQARVLELDKAACLSGGPIFMRENNETADATVERLFGSWEAAAECYAMFADQIEATSPGIGSRSWAFWQFSAPPRWEGSRRVPRGLKVRKQPPTRCRPIPWDEVAVLKRLGELTELEQHQLKEMS